MGARTGYSATVAVGASLLHVREFVRFQVVVWTYLLAELERHCPSTRTAYELYQSAELDVGQFSRFPPHGVHDDSRFDDNPLEQACERVPDQSFGYLEFMNDEA